MSLEAFQDIIDHFGEDPAHWPEGRRADAAALLDADPAAQALVADAAIVRAWLRRRAVKAPDRLAQAIDDRLRDTEHRDMQGAAARAGARS
jgi:hypothetical protein